MKKIKYIGDLSAVLIGGVYNRKVKRGQSAELPDDLAKELLARKIKGRPQWESAETKTGAASDKKKP